MELSKTAYVILGMLRTRAHTGYEIKAIVDHSTRFFWAASYGQIYPGAEAPRGGRAGGGRGRARRTAGGGAPTRSPPPGGEALEDWITSGRAAALRDAPRGAAALLLRRRRSTPTSSSSWCATMREMHERTRGRDAAPSGPTPRRRASERGQEFPLRTLEFGIAYQDFIVEWCSRSSASSRAS